MIENLENNSLSQRTHIKRKSAITKLMSSKENIEIPENPKTYSSLLRGKQVLNETKFNEKK